MATEKKTVDEAVAEKKPAAKKTASATAKKPAAAKSTTAAEEKPAAKKPAAEKKAPAKKAAAPKADAVKAEAAPAKTAAAPKKKAVANGVTVRLVKSFEGRLDSQIITAKSLGLRKIGDVSVQPDNAATRGKIAKISHLIEVIESK